MTNKNRVETALRMLAIFFPHYEATRQHMEKGAGRLVHYTKLETAYLILKNREFWLRNAAVMNDYSEIAWGEYCLDFALRSPEGVALKEAIDAVHPDTFELIQIMLTQWKERFRTKTYIASFALHDPSEDVWGRLSMWRAYGNAALVFKGRPFFEVSDATIESRGPTSSPVAYFTPPETAAHLGRIAQSIRENEAFIKCLGPDRVQNTLFTAFRYGLICNKHPGFREEREWRVMHSDGWDPQGALGYGTVVIAGVPQKIVKFSIRNDTVHEVTDNSLSDLLDRIIIGPCKHPHTARDALVDLLREANVADAADKVVISNIPLRE